MIEMTNLEYLIASNLVKERSYLGDSSNFITVYEVNGDIGWRTKEEAIKKAVLWLREKHKDE